MIIQKTIGNRKTDCAWVCARAINTTWENLQIEKHKSGRRAFRSPDWFVLFDLQIFSGGVYPRAQPHAQSLFLFPIVFGIWFIFSMRRKTVQPEIRSFFFYGASIPCHAIWQKQNEESGTVSKSATFLAMESVNSAPFKRGETKVQLFGKEKCKILRQ